MASALFEVSIESEASMTQEEAKVRSYQFGNINTKYWIDNNQQCDFFDQADAWSEVKLSAWSVHPDTEKDCTGDPFFILRLLMDMNYGKNLFDKELVDKIKEGSRSPNLPILFLSRQATGCKCNLERPDLPMNLVVSGVFDGENTWVLTKNNALFLLRPGERIYGFSQPDVLYASHIHVEDDTVWIVGTNLHDIVYWAGNSSLAIRGYSKSEILKSITSSAKPVNTDSPCVIL